MRHLDSRLSTDLRWNQRLSDLSFAALLAQWPSAKACVRAPPSIPASSIHCFFMFFFVCFERKGLGVRKSRERKRNAFFFQFLSRRHMAQVKLAFTATWGLLPAHVQATFSSWTVPSSSHAMAQRNPCIRLPRPARKDTQQKSPFYSTFSLWNSLPAELQRQQALISCSFSLRVTLSDSWPVVACCDCSIPAYAPIPIPPRLSHSQ